jgi:uncharacterized protein (TIGR00304 family)
MQSESEFELLGIILIMVGIILIFIGTAYLFTSANHKQAVRKESKGVILIGPIPIIWGFGKKGKIIGIILFTLVIIAWILLFFF